MNKEAVKFTNSLLVAYKSFCAPLNEYFGISNVRYTLAFNNGKYFFLSNDASLNQSFCTNIKEAKIIFRTYLDNNISYDCILWPFFPVGDIMEMHVQHGYWHGITLIIDKSPQHIEAFAFLANKNNPGIIDFYIKYAKVLELFAKEFKKKFGHIANRLCEDSKELAVMPNGIELCIPDKNLIQDQNKIEAFFKEMGINEQSLNLNLLTPTEMSVLKSASRGYSSKYIAKELDKMSQKTVEVHIHNIKKKLGIYSKDKLIKSCQDFF